MRQSKVTESVPSLGPREHMQSEASLTTWTGREVENTLGVARY